MNVKKIVINIIILNEIVLNIVIFKGTNLCPSDTIVDAIAPPVTPA